MSNNNTTAISLTGPQYSAAERAVDGLIHFYERMLLEHQIREMPPMPQLDGVLILPSDNDVLNELLWRLEVQIPDEMRDREQHNSERAQDDRRCDPMPAVNLAKKIRAVTGFVGLAS